MSNQNKQQKRCANCYVCVVNTDMCPLNENYRERSLDEWLESIRQKKQPGDDKNDK